MPRQFRRVVTGHDAEGRSVVISDGPTTQTFQRPNRPGVRMHNFWKTDSTPAAVDGPAGTLADPFVLHPPKGGTIVRIIEFDPEDPAVMAKVDGRTAFADMGAAGNVVEGARHPFMHATMTVDYAIVLQGEITMLMDDEKDDVHLKAGDVLIQRATNHAWSNRGTETCVVAFILIDGEKTKPE